MISRILEKLETLYSMNEETKKTAYEEQDWEKFDLFMHRNEGVYFAKKIVQEVAREYDAFDVIYKKVCELEGEYAEGGDIENVNRCIRLENLLQYFKEELIAPYQKGE